MNTTVTPTKTPESPAEAATIPTTDAATSPTCTRSRLGSPESGNDDAGLLTPTFTEAWSRDRTVAPAITSPAQPTPARVAPRGPSLAQRIGYAVLDVFSPTPSDIALGRVGSAASSPRG